MARAVGIDLGGTKLSAGVVDTATGHVLARAEIPTPDDDLPAAFARLLAGLPVDGAAGAGLGAAGIVDCHTGRYLYGPNTGLTEIDLGAMVRGVSGLECTVDNDANCAAWAEHRFGAGAGTRDFMCVTLGTGVGGGFVLDGRPYRGAHGGAAEIGHILVDPDGLPCGCGRRGCWEQYASGGALERLAAAGLSGRPDSALHDRCEGDPSRVEGRWVTDAARAGDRFAADCVDEVARWIGEGLGSLVNVLEPELIAISGGLVEDWDLFEVKAAQALRDRMEAPEHRPVPKLVAGSLGPDAGLVGAALLASD